MAVTRKEFLVRLAVGGVAVGASSTIASFLASCSLPTEPQGSSLPTSSGTLSSNKVTVDISSGSPLAQNGFAIVQYTGGSLLVARTDDGVYHAMTSICTHLGCSIDHYNSGSKEFVCPCHGSRFNTTGGVTNGPASTALKQYVTSVSGTQLIITLS
ncbi:MAG: Rieske (2Fe-2S) protein [Bacteroidota bacterium]|jgi:Rieske Fe-S protein